MRYFTITHTRRRGQALLAVAMATLALAALLGVLGSLPTAEARGPATANTGNSGFSLSSSDAITIFLPIVFKSEQVVVFFDDFNSTSSGWPHKVQFENCYYEYSGGRYRVKVTRNGQRCIVPNFQIPKQVNGTFEVKVRRTTSSSRPLRYGFLFGAGANAVEDHWALEVYPFASCGTGDKKGDFWLVALVDGARKLFETVCTDAIDVDTSDWNTLTVIRTASHVTVYINGDEKGEWDNDYLENQGYFDLQVISGSNDDVIVEYDDVKILKTTSAP